MASYTNPILHATGDDLAVTDYNAVASNTTFLYQRPYANYYNSVATVCANVGLTQITLGGTTTSGYGFSISSNNVIVPLAGIYLVAFSAGFQLASGVSGTALGVLEHNGSQVAYGATISINNNVFQNVSPGSTIVSCSASDTLGLYGYQATGSTLNTSASSLDCFISVLWMGSQ